MNKRITILIIASIIALTGLSAIQYVLISNTYELEKKALIKETDDALSEFDDSYELDSLFSSWGEGMKTHIADHKNDRMSAEEVKTRIFEDAHGINSTYSKVVDAAIDDSGLDYDVSYKKNISSIVVYHGSRIDTIFPQSSGEAVMLFGQDFKEDKANVVNRSKWFTNHEFISTLGDSITSDIYDLEVRTSNLILIDDKELLVFERMSGLLIGSFLVFLIMIGLFYFSIRNLVTQKRIADIKTDFINNITHELKTPLATLSIASKSLRKEEIQNSPQAFSSTLEIVDRQNERVQKLIDQVMSNSLSAEEIVLNKEEVSDSEYFAALLTDFQLSTQNKDISVDNRMNGTEVFLRIDRFHLTTALLNILENAVKYGKEQVGIILRTELKNSQYLISIKDNGIGISEKDQRQLFQKFYRVSEGDRHNVKGLGLGLYLADQIVRAHHGRLSVNSDLGKGTEFIIQIPVK